MAYVTVINEHQHLQQPPAQPAEQVDDLATGQVGPEGHVAGDVGEPAVQRHGLPPRIAAQQRGPAAIGT